MTTRRLVIMGASGFGTEAVWVAESMNAALEDRWEILGYADDRDELAGSELYGYKVLGAPARLGLTGEIWYYCAIGSNRARQVVAARLDEAGWRAATLVHPSVIRAREVDIGPGTYVGAGSILSPRSKLGRHVLVNQRVSVGHDAQLGDFSQACPGAQINGGCRLGAGALVGSNASIHQGKAVGDGAVVGANSHVVRSVPAGVTVVGVPARQFSAGPA